MVDIGTGLTIAGSSPLLIKLLGPTAEYLGDGLRGFAQKRITNLQQIFLGASKKIGDKINEEGTIPARVLFDVLNAGGFCEDELGKEYFSGVLASSRSLDGKDDRGAIFIGMISRMSNWEIRAHYIFYTIIRRLYPGKYNTFTKDLREKMQTTIETGSLLQAMNINEYSSARNLGIISQIMWGLYRESLIEDFTYNETTFIFSPTVMGSHLYLWANGKGRSHESMLLNSEENFSEVDGVMIPNGYCSWECNFPEEVAQ